MTETRFTGLADKAAVIFALGTFAFAGYVLFGPTGALRHAWAAAVKGRELRAQVRALDPALRRVGQSAGAVKASSAIFEVFDYQCPYCRLTDDSVAAWLKKHPDANVVRVHFPLLSHPAAIPGAKAAICAERVGVLPAMHHYLVTESEWQQSPQWGRIGARVGVRDTAAFVECLGAADVAARLDSNIALGRQLGIQGTPTFVSLKGRHVGLVTMEQLDALR